MQDDCFEWDDAKAEANRRKHGVTFEEAREEFDDLHYTEEPDDDPDEERWKLIGRSRRRLLVVIYTDRGSRMRIISARKATRHDQDTYDR